MLHSVIVHHGHIVNVRHGEGDDVIVVGVVNVDAPDLDLTSIQKELSGFWEEERKKTCTQDKKDNLCCIYICIYIYTHTYIHTHTYLEMKGRAKRERRFLNKPMHKVY